MEKNVDYRDMPEVLTVADLQRVLQIGRSTAYQLIQTKQLRFIRIGRSIRIPKAFVREFLEANYFPVEDSSKMC